MSDHNIALLALGFSILSALAAGWSALAGHRSAGHAKTSADAAKDAADSSRISARAAEKSADADGKVAQVELDRDHRDLAPILADLRFENRTNEATKRTGVFLVFTPERTYRMHGDMLNAGGSRTPLSMFQGTTLEGGVETWAHVGDQSGALPEAVEMRFYPPGEGDPGEPWTCQCGEPAQAEDHGSRGHWVVRRKVNPPAITMAIWR